METRADPSARGSVLSLTVSARCWVEDRPSERGEGWEEISMVRGWTEGLGERQPMVGREYDEGC